jgi:multidrug efflux pump subunit AcrB
MSKQKESYLENLIFNILENKSKRVFIYIITFILFVGSLYMLPLELVKAKMLPGKDSDSFSLYVDLPVGSSVNQTKKVTTCISKELMKHNIVLSASIFLAEGQPLDFAGMVKGSALKMGEHEAEIMVNIKRAEKRDKYSFNFIHDIRSSIQTKCSLYKANIKFIELPSGPPTLADIVVEVSGGNSFDSRREFAKKIVAILKKQKTLVDVDILADDRISEYKLILNNNKILDSGIGLEQIKKVLYVAFEGASIGTINKKDAENQIDIFLRLDSSRLLKATTISNIRAKLNKLMLMNPLGLTIPMSNFITIKEVKSIPSISSKNLINIINVIASTDMDSQIYPLLDARSDMKKILSNDYNVSYSNMLNLSFVDKKTKEKFDIVWDGELKVTIDTFIDLGMAFIGALILIYFLMVVYYKKFSLAGAIVLSSFLSLIGVILAHFVMDLITADRFYLTATSLIGFIGLIGINSRNSLLIIDFAKQLIREKNLTANRAIAISVKTRAKPILLTVLAIVFASSLLASDAVFGGLGVALIGGTFFSYLVSLFFVPIIIHKSI